MGKIVFTIDTGDIPPESMIELYAKGSGAATDAVFSDAAKAALVLHIRDIVGGWLRSEAARAAAKAAAAQMESMTGNMTSTLSHV